MSSRKQELPLLQFKYTGKAESCHKAIRLLTIKNPSLFVLDSVPLSEASRFKAISYCWAKSPLQYDTAIINNQLVRLERNVCGMLNTLHRVHDIERVWIDTICINQSDPEEKSEQVQLMGEIYSIADATYTWLGAGDPIVGMIFDVLTIYSQRKRCEEVPESYDPAEQLSFYRELFRQTYREKARQLGLEGIVYDEQIDEEINWLHPFYSLPYWTRVWPVQELVLAKKIKLCYMDKSINFDDIYGLSPDHGSFEQLFETGAYARMHSQTRGWGAINAINGHRNARNMVTGPFMNETNEIKMYQMRRGDVAKLDEVIRLYARNHECKCPKDKVYGFRALIPEWKDLRVDYSLSKSVRDVFVDVVRLGLLDESKYGGWYVAEILWKAMRLDKENDFEQFMSGNFPEVVRQRRSPDSLEWCFSEE